MKRALCPFCELPRATVRIVRCGSYDVPLISCECIPRDRFWALGALESLADVRAIPMTENHDPGDEERA